VQRKRISSFVLRLWHNFMAIKKRRPRHSNDAATASFLDGLAVLLDSHMGVESDQLFTEIRDLARSITKDQGLSTGLAAQASGLLVKCPATFTDGLLFLSLSFISDDTEPPVLHVMARALVQHGWHSEAIWILERSWESMGLSPETYNGDLDELRSLHFDLARLR